MEKWTALSIWAPTGSRPLGLTPPGFHPAADMVALHSLVTLSNEARMKSRERSDRTGATPRRKSCRSRDHGKTAGVDQALPRTTAA